MLDNSAWWDEALMAAQPRGVAQGRGGESRGGSAGHAGTLASPMLTRLDLRGRSGDDLASALARPEPGGDGPLDAVREIIADVRKRGDDALRDLTARFDGVELEDLRVPRGELSHALATLPPAFREALAFSRDQILAYHRTQAEEAPR